ncbi:MAG: SDR family NAD(P)-dependent oxidoreductase, partial [Acidimicrobiia bacterium]|nr:SDR family NAD(P)-dependent oxidoreductase [Acidimicrobiia bacterium]
MDIAGRVALVTGGGVRVGRALALGLGRAGADVFVHYNRSSAGAEATAAVIAAGGTRSAIGSADLADPAVAPDLVAAATSALGPVSILVNAASGFPADTLADVSIEGWQATIDFTLAGPVFLTQAFAAALPADAGGAVVNITDVKTTTTPYRKHFSYMVAKGGI